MPDPADDWPDFAVIGRVKIAPEKQAMPDDLTIADELRERDKLRAEIARLHQRCERLHELLWVTVLCGNCGERYRYNREDLPCGGCPKCDPDSNCEALIADTGKERT